MKVVVNLSGDDEIGEGDGEIGREERKRRSSSVDVGDGGKILGKKMMVVIYLEDGSKVGRRWREEGEVG